ncbi:hypothetical protein P8C59_006077 [Phyllachora maydis]|uniref:Uncharacterized protein n=1 Tax=Phyllachora maydis TaxID=1825666 RepID=A0AAD9MG79_9PEZI|nr:hypothetical protein P8C59_006077 [Phyllachora maydis]
MFLVRSLLTPYVRQSSTAFTSAVFTKSCPVLRLAASAQRTFSTTPPNSATINQVLRGCRKAARARHAVSPALAETDRPQAKGVCLKRRLGSVGSGDSSDQQK